MQERVRNFRDKLTNIPPVIATQIGNNTTDLQLVDNTRSEIDIFINEPSVDSVIEESARILSQKYWWVGRNIEQEFGVLKEKWNLKVGDHKINIFNFWQPLENNQAEEIKNGITTMSSILPSSVFGLNDIVISEKQSPNLYIGEPANGDWLTPNDYSTFRLYPAAFETKQSRVTPNISNLQGTVVHELAHSVDTNTVNDWRKLFGWRLLFRSKGDQPRILKGGWESWEVCVQTDRCVTEYAQSGAGEDISESFVAYAYNPQRLFSGKEMYLEIEFPKGKEYETSIDIAQDLDIPILPKIIPYSLQPSRAFILPREE